MTCVAVGCSMRRGTNLLSNVKMIKFPSDPDRRRQWELAVRRANWKSTKYSHLCNKHFISGKTSSDPAHPDYIPTIFAYNENIRNERLQRYERSLKRKETTCKSSKDPACSDGSPTIITVNANACSEKKRRRRKRQFKRRKTTSKSEVSSFRDASSMTDITMEDMAKFDPQKGNAVKYIFVGPENFLNSVQNCRI